MLSKGRQPRSTKWMFTKIDYKQEDIDITDKWRVKYICIASQMDSLERPMMQGLVVLPRKITRQGILKYHPNMQWDIAKESIEDYIIYFKKNNDYFTERREEKQIKRV